MQAQLIISSRNRPDFLVTAIHSALNQTVPFSRIIVSDNSSKNPEQQALMAAVASQFACHRSVLIIATIKELSAHDHFKFIQRTYIPDDDSLSIVFHDDDELLPNFHNTIIETFDTTPNLSAVSCNAKILNNNGVRKLDLMRTIKGTTLIYTKEQFFDYYCNFISTAPAPFPAYCYRSHLLKRLDFNRAYGGKYSDVAGLSQLLEHAPIMWLHSPLMNYRKHALQDSRTNDIIGRRLLTCYIRNQCGENETRAMLTAYRVKYLFTTMRPKQLLSHREVKIIQFSLAVVLKRLVTSISFYKFFMSIISRKLWIF